ncbi:MAG: Asp-tRNA(Asn)/Glu-tRNA(Gln) amidotransferase GatCAB subunit B, partial [Patescibacteria group bacterium]
EPDIPPMHFSTEEIERIRKTLPKMPAQLREEYLSLGLTEAEADMLVSEPVLRAHFDAVREKTGDAKRASSLVLTQLAGFLNAAGKTSAEGPSTRYMVDLAAAIKDGTISGNAGKDVLETMVGTGKGPKEIIEAAGMKQISDAGALEKLVDEAIAKNPKAIESYKAGKTAALGAIVGWVMKETKGQANPAIVNDILLRKL